MDEEVDISELTQLMLVGLIGANQTVQKLLEDFHEKHNRFRHGFLFYECLLHLPIQREGALDLCKPDSQERWVFLPILYRLARESLVMIAPKKAREFVKSVNGKSENEVRKEIKRLFDFSTIEDIASTDILVKLKHTIYTQFVCKYWKNGEVGSDFEYCDLQPYVEPQEFHKPFFLKIRNYAPDKLRDKIIERLCDPCTDALSKESFLILHGIVSPQFECLREKFECLREKEKATNGEEITAFLIPIASREMFYGNLFICLPQFKWKDMDEIKRLTSDLLRYARDYYVPALALIHEHFYEGLLSQRVKEFTGQKYLTNTEIKKLHTEPYKLKLNGGQADYKAFICRSPDKICFECQYFGWEEASDNVVEKYLHKLWQDRKTIGETRHIKESLFFKERLYTDPEMLGKLERFLKPSKARLKKEDCLPSILIEAPPGAGKESMARLFKLFSDYYNRGETYRLNMASLKPDAVAPIAMVGGVVAWSKSIYQRGEHEETGIAQDAMLIGLLQQIRERTHYEFQEFFSSFEKDGFIPRLHSYLNDLNRSISNRKEDRIAEQLKVQRKHLRGVLNELDKHLIRLEKGKVEQMIQEFNGVQDEVERGAKEAIGKLEEQMKVKIEEIRALTEKKKEELKEGMDEFLKGLRPQEKLIIKELFGRFPTLVLDELNSMSIESQGVLLRFVENAEITPIGSYEDRMKDGKAYREFLTDFLVVGLMNEDPEEITRERAIEFLKRKDSYISGLLGDLLYEHVLRIRRLRPDLRQRMMRYGKFKMPELARHRADIPVIFYLQAKKAKDDYFPNSEIRITMDVLEYLMRPELEWPENVRLLQTLTNKVMEVLYEDYRDASLPKTKGRNLIRQKHIEVAMREIGMLKETED